MLPHMQVDHSQRAWDIMMWARTHELFPIYRRDMDAEGLAPGASDILYVIASCENVPQQTALEYVVKKK